MPLISRDEILPENHSGKATKREKMPGFIVGFSFRQRIERLDSYSTGAKRFLSLECKFKFNAKLKLLYD